MHLKKNVFAEEEVDSTSSEQGNGEWERRAVSTKKKLNDNMILYSGKHLEINFARQSTARGSRLPTATATVCHCERNEMFWLRFCVSVLCAEK